MNIRLASAIAVIGLAGLLWWQTRPSSSAERRAPASSSTSRFIAAPPALEPRADDPDAPGWRPPAHDPADWQPGEEPIGWDRWVADFVRPRPGEGLLEYRDRLVPVAQLAIAPHRAAAERTLEGSAARAGLGAAERGEIDDIIERAQRQLERRVREAVFGGELFGPDARPIDGVRFARDLLDVVLAADAAVGAALTPAQRRALDEGGFDVAVYLLVATRWERLVGVD